MSGSITLNELMRLFPRASQAIIRHNSIDVPQQKKEEDQIVTIKPTTDEEKLNKTERAYLGYLRRLEGIVWIGIQNITLKLADDCRFTPDFATLNDKGELTLVDVKGFQREDALIKAKVAARQFPWARFVIVKRDGSGWTHNEVKP